MAEATFYNVWRTKTPEDRAALVSRMRDAAPALAAKPGFLSMSVLECPEDGRVLVEGVWQSQDAFHRAVSDDPAMRRSRDSLAQFGSPEPGLFKEAFRALPAPPKVDIKEGHAKVNGQVIHYLRAGSGPALLLVHGYPESSESWLKVLPGLAQHFTVIAPDTRGVGKSSIAADFSLEDVADDLYEVMKSLGYSEVCLVGHDFGVQVVSAYAAKHRELVSALAVIESPLSGFGLEDLFADHWHFGFLASPLAQTLIAGREREFFHAFAFDSFVCRKGAISAADIDRYIENQRQPGRLKAGLTYYRALPLGKAFFARTVLPPWLFPILAIDGDHGMNGLTAKSFSRVAPGLRSQLVPDCGHFVQEEQPALLVEMLLKFLTGEPVRKVPE